MLRARRSPRPVPLVAAIGGALLLAGWLAATVVAKEEVPVTVEGFTFGPGTVTVAVGDAVTWTNNDSAPHTATSGSAAPEAFDTGTLEQGESATVVFDTPGTYDYVCRFHASMRGTVIVEAPAASSAEPEASQLPDGALATPRDGARAAVILLVLGLAALTALSARAALRRRA